MKLIQLPIIYFGYFAVTQLFFQCISAMSGFGFYPSQWRSDSYCAVGVLTFLMAICFTVWTMSAIDNINKQNQQ